MGNSINILVVEDSIEDAELIIAELRQAGYDPKWKRVETEPDFLAELTDWPDIVLSDYSMPRFSGLKAAKLLRQSGLGIPFILVSGTVGEDVAVEAMKYGVSDYLLKDRITRIGPAVQRALEEQRLRDQQQQAQEDLKRANEVMQQMLAHSPVVLYRLLIQQQGVIPVKVSENVERLLGFTEQEVMSYDWWLGSLHPEDRPRVLAALAEGTAAGGCVMEYRIRHKNGSYCWIEDSNRTIYDASGRPAEIVGVWTDISDRQKAEAALRESEAKFRQLAENIKEVFWITDPTRRQMLYISPAYEEIWGRTCNSIYESPQSWIDAIHPEDQSRVLAASVENQQSGDYDETYRIVRPDGSIRWIRDRGFPVRNSAGQTYRIVGTAEDVTQQKETEQQFRQAQKMEGIGFLAGGVAHDFNNILMIIQVNLELVLMEEKNLQPQTKNYLADIAQAADRAVALNRQLLTFSRSEAMEMRTLDLNELAGAFSKMLRRIVGEHIRILNDFAEGLPPVKADPGMIEQVLMNLAVNSRDAMPNGGQVIIASNLVVVDEARAKLNPRMRAGHFACLSVRDTGTGIAPEHMGRIFEPFFTTKGVGKGTGLGLATVFGIAEQHKGWVEVSSEVGVGTTFRVFLPVSSEDVANAESALAKKIPGGTETVLLVEDEIGVRHVLHQSLENYGYTVLEADSGITAQKIWAEYPGPIDLVITDMVMPGGLTSLELINLLRVEKPTLKILLMSGYSAELARGDALRASGVKYLHKPFSTQVLIETVRKCFDTM